MPSKTKGEEQLAALETVFEALAHPARRQILLTMKFRGGRVTSGEIAGRFRHTWPTTTRHLRVLEAAQLVSRRKRGKRWVYCLERQRLRVITDWIRWFEVDVEVGS